MPAINRRMLNDVLITSSSESILDFLIHYSEITRGKNLQFYRKTFPSSLTV